MNMKDQILKLISEWKYGWMKQDDNYLHRASGIDANMKHSLADKIVKFIEKESKIRASEEIKEIHEAVSGLINFFPPTHVFQEGSEAFKLQGKAMEVYALFYKMYESRKVNLVCSHIWGHFQRQPKETCRVCGIEQEAARS
jgi:hypothetical protein